MIDIKYGGPAFPESYVGCDAPHEGIGNGMTLRDYFAAAAMGARLRWNEENGHNFGYVSETDIARSAYRQADAMISARKRE